MTSIEIKILALMDSFSQSEQKVAKYFLNNMQSVFHLPIAQLAEESKVSQVAWVRFCKQLGFNGLKDLKKSLFSELNTAPEPQPAARAFADIKDYSSTREIAATVMASSVQAIENTMQLMDYTVLHDTAKLLVGASSVRLFGIGASGLVAEDFYDKLQRIGKCAYYSHDTHIQLTYAVNLKKTDAAFFISNSGATQEILETIAIAKAAGCRTASLTKYGPNPLAELADYNLYTSSPEVYLRSGAMSSRIAQLTVIDTLFTDIANQDYAHIEESLEKSFTACAAHKTL